MPIPIVLLSFNTLPFTRTCIRSIRANTFVPYKLYVFDNGSVDGSVEYLSRVRGISFVAWPENLGVSKGWNEAVGMLGSDASMFVLMNSDCIMTPGWLLYLQRVLEDDDSIAVVASMLLSQFLPDNVIHGGGHPTIDGAHKTGRVSDFTTVTEEVWVTFASVLLRTSIFKVLGGFDETLFVYGQDSDYCRRARSAGYKIMFAPQSRVFHCVAKSVAALRKYDNAKYSQYVRK